MKSEKMPKPIDPKISASAMLLRWVLRVGFGVLLFFIGLYAGHYLSHSVAF